MTEDGRRNTIAAALAALCLLAAGAAPASVEAQAPRCHAAVQGEIAWNYDGDTRWASSNVARLCEGARGSREPARCFRRVMHSGEVDWGGGTRWQWENALELCQGTRDASATIRCFERRVDGGAGWGEAIEACRWDAAGDDGDADEGDGDDSGPIYIPDSLRIYPPGGDDGGSASRGAEAIHAKYRSLEGRSGRLGPPEQSVRTNPDGTGKRRRYENGHIYWHPRTGAHVVYEGGIWDKWADRRWEEGPLGYPVADPEPNPTGPGSLQRFEHGALLAFDREPVTDTWERAGRSDFSVRPSADAEHCVQDVPAAFDAITFGRRNGRNFYSREVQRADRGHMQGVARLPGGWLAQSYSKGVFLTHFPGQDGSGHDAWVGGPQSGVPTFPDLPNVWRKHVGGIHAYGDLLVVPSDARVEIFRHRSGHLEHLNTFDVSEHQPGAHFASIVPLAGGDWLLAVGRDSRQKYKPHRVYFYVVPSLEASQSELRYLGRRGRGNTRKDFQSGSLVADCDGTIYFVGTGVQVAQANAHAKLYRVVEFSRDGGGNPDRAKLDPITERSPNSERNDCNLNAGVSFFPTADGKLVMYCTEKQIKDGNITTREYRDENG